VPTVKCTNPACPNELPAQHGPGPRVKWCSDKCRKTKYSRPCVDCGKPTDGSNGHGPKAPARCTVCAHRFEHESRHWTPERIVDAIQRWAAEKGSPPSASRWFKSRPVDYPSIPTVQREFGSWASAIEAAGFPRPVKNLSGRPGEDPELCREIKRRREAGERVVDLAREYGCSPHTIYNRSARA
jgi:hypothetical protein